MRVDPTIPQNRSKTRKKKIKRIWWITSLMKILSSWMILTNKVLYNISTYRTRMSAKTYNINNLMIYQESDNLDLATNLIINSSNLKSLTIQTIISMFNLETISRSKFLWGRSTRPQSRKKRSITPEKKTDQVPDQLTPIPKILYRNKVQINVFPSKAICKVNVHSLNKVGDSQLNIR